MPFDGFAVRKAASVERLPFSWRARRWLWDRVILIKYKGQKPAKIPIPDQQERELLSVPIRAVIPSIPIEAITMADHVPKDEAKLISRLFYKAQMLLLSVFGPHQDGLPSVSDDPNEMLREAYGESKAKLFPPPKMPLALDGEHPDIGRLAVEGPYAGILATADDGRSYWDFRELGSFEHWPGLYSLGVRAQFETKDGGSALTCTLIECELGTISPGNESWDLATRILLCSVTTYVSLIRHFCGVHLAIGAQIAIATRNRLSQDHPLLRLLWPHIYGSQYSNDLVTLGQMAPQGDFPMIFSFTHRGMCDLFEHMYPRLSVRMYDPTREENRGVSPDVATPAYDTLRPMFDLFLEHTSAYIDAYYESDTALRADEAVGEWLDELHQNIPNGVPVLKADMSKESLAHLIAVFMYVVIVEHEFRGTFLWNYQLFVNKQPIRVYKDGRREPVDVYQRMVNANMLLNVPRTVLTEDFSYLAVDGKGAKLFLQFRERLHELQRAMVEDPREVWKLYPDMLNANMNA